MNIFQLTVLLGVSASLCDGVHVSMREKRQFAMLFQAVVLPCQFQTSSTQTPVVQWWYKSFCRDRTQDSFSLPETLGKTTSDLGTKSHLECSDSSRTSRIVASAQGASMTLAEHYKGRDIAIINKADLRIGELQWGDSGVYFCKVIIADDVEGKNEAQLELLVLGRTGEQNDLLPEFDLEIMPEWAFVGSVVLGSVLFLLLLGICWCQCCPHSCCCYLSCCCCPDTCCCPRHLYEAGKLAKSTKTAQIPVYPYYIPGVPSVAPSVVPLAPSSHIEPKMVSLPSVENNLAGASSLSELSSLHDGGNNDFRNTYQKVQMKALPPIADLDDQSMSRVGSTAQSHRYKMDRAIHSDDELDTRWNPHSEHIQRKSLGRRGRTGSLDELEEFARSYSTRCHRDRTYERDYSPPRRPYRNEEDWRHPSPPPVPRKRSDTWDSDRPRRPYQNRGYDDAYLTSVLESKARGRTGERGATRADEDSDTPRSDSYYSRSPSNRPEEDDPLPPYSEWEAERYRRAGPTNNRYRTVEPPGTESYRTSEATSRPFSYTRPPPGTLHAHQSSREDRDRNRNLSTALSRESLLLGKGSTQSGALCSRKQQQDKETSREEDRPVGRDGKLDACWPCCCCCTCQQMLCPFSTSATSQDVLVSWKFKSFCKDPVLEYYSTAYQAALQLGQDPSNDCPDRQRTVRTVIQKREADLVITEVMWWDNGVYYCTIDAAGDTTGDSDREVKLIVYHWLTVLLIIIGALLLIMLFCICCCQCCPQKCCCYVRCPCCPKTCCCPEKAVMQHRMIREAQKAMVPWMNGQPIYAPISSNASTQGVPILYSGSYSDYPKKQNLAMAPMPLSTMVPQTYAPPFPLVNGSLQGSVQETSQVLDYLENQVRGLDVSPLPQTMAPLQSHSPPGPPPVPYTPGPPSMLSALDDMGVRGVERRVITLPPIIQRNPSFTSHRGPGAAERGRAGPRLSSQSSGSTNRSGARGYRDTSPPRRGILRDYNEDSDWDNRHSRAPQRRNERGGSSGRRSGGSRPRARSRDDLIEELQSRRRRRERSYSPPQRHKGSWSSDEDNSSSRRRKGGKDKDWLEKPPSYFSIEMQPGHSKRNYDRLSDRSSRSGTSVVI
ncbi:hypothetical protein WMY93_028628 [Mugilogobius chulae]|uniref:Ig-like domain-containing protein n=1 Tax=Mugilogobius chulae TaxID=88201 RepID=A0AAW0MXZ5_9GOBI